MDTARTDINDPLHYETIYIGSWSSKCGRCNGNALPNEGSHISQPDYQETKLGCGQVWKYMMSTYMGIEGLEESLTKSFPHLIYRSNGWENWTKS